MSDGDRLIINEITVYGEIKSSKFRIVLIVLGTFAIILVGVFLLWERRRLKGLTIRCRSRRTEPHADTEPEPTVLFTAGQVHRMIHEAVTTSGLDDYIREREATSTCELEDQTRRGDQIEIPADSEISNLAPPAYTDSLNVHREDVVPSYEEVMTNLDSFSVANS